MSEILWHCVLLLTCFPVSSRMGWGEDWVHDAGNVGSQQMTGLLVHNLQAGLRRYDRPATVAESRIQWCELHVLHDLSGWLAAECCRCLRVRQM